MSNHEPTEQQVEVAMKTVLAIMADAPRGVRVSARPKPKRIKKLTLKERKGLLAQKLRQSGAGSVTGYFRTKKGG